MLHKTFTGAVTLLRIDIRACAQVNSTCALSQMSSLQFCVRICLVNQKSNTRLVRAVFKAVLALNIAAKGVIHTVQS